MAPRRRGLTHAALETTPQRRRRAAAASALALFTLVVVVMRLPLAGAFHGYVRRGLTTPSQRLLPSSFSSYRAFSTLLTHGASRPVLPLRVATAMAARKKKEEEGGGQADEAAAAAAAAKKKKEEPEKRIGRGPRNRRQMAASAEEEEFSALADKATPILGEDGLPRRRPPVVSRSMGPPKKRPAMTFDPTWQAKGSSQGSSGNGASSSSRKPQEDVVRPASTVARATPALMEEEDEDEDDGELLDLPKNMVIRALDSESYEKARKLANLDDDEDEEEEGWEEEEEDWEGEGGEEFDEEGEDWDEEQEEEGEEWEDDDEELPPIPTGKVLSMEERLRMAETGNFYNPHVARMHTRSSSSSSSAGGKAKKVGDDEDDEALFSDDEGEEGEEDYAPRLQPVKYQYKIVMDVGTCPGCGNSFQTKNDSAPGFVPTDVYQRMQSMMMSSRKTKPSPLAAPVSKSKAAAMRKAAEQAQVEDLFQGLTAEEEVEMLISGKDRATFDKELAAKKGGKAVVEEEEEEEDFDEDSEDEKEKDDEDEDMRTVICQRCHKLKHYGEVEDSLRPGWSDNELLTPERFRELVSVVRKKRCAVVCLVDIFDFHGSLLYNLPRIVGDNPVLIAVNKADLLPSDFSEERVRIWVKQELEKVGMKDVNTRNIHMISCKTGGNVKPLLRAMKTLARQRKRDLYVIGAANVGKSTFINRLIELGRSGGDKKKQQKDRKKDPSKAAGMVTTSPLPGTTLNFIEVDLGDKVSLYDTPGLILPHQITTLLSTEELKAVIPQKRINHVTLRLKEGKSVLLGGLVRLDMVEGRPFLFTFYVSNDVKLHQTSTDRADEFLDKHIGELVFPPYTPERRAELGAWVPRDFEIEGTGWKTSAIDIVISGLGWISVTGALGCKVRVMAPEAVGVRLRSPLMPYETWATTAKWTGLRAIKSDKQKGSSR